MITKETIADIDKEMARQDAKWGPPRFQPSVLWATILAEEFGEVAKEALSIRFNPRREANLHQELVELLAVGTQWLQTLKRPE